MLIDKQHSLVQTIPRTMPARLKNRKGCSECAHCRAWKANKAFVRTTKANGGKLKQFLTCNHCSRAYRTTGYINEDDFHKKYRGRDHDEYAIPKIKTSRYRMAH